MYNCKYSCVITAMAVYNCFFISFLGSRYKNRHYVLYLCMIHKKRFNPSWNSCGHSHAFLACQLLIFFISVRYSFCHTITTLSVAGRIKKIIKIKKHEMDEISVMESISLHENCVGEELNNVFCLFLHNLFISNTYMCHQQMCVM